MSEYLNLLAALERKSGCVVSWIGDPQMGQSLGDLRDGVDWFAPSVEEILVMLRVAAIVMMGPVIASGLVLGLFIGLMQALTQIQDQTGAINVPHFAVTAAFRTFGYWGYVRDRRW